MEWKFKATGNQASLPPGVYPATLDTIEERDGPKGGFLIWHFLVEVDGRTVSVGATTSLKCSPTAKAYHFTQALMGRPIVADEEIDPPTLCGRACRVVVIVAELEDRSTVNRIETILPAQDAEIPF